MTPGRGRTAPAPDELHSLRRTPRRIGGLPRAEPYRDGAAIALDDRVPVFVLGHLTASGPPVALGRTASVEEPDRSVVAVELLLALVEILVALVLVLRGRRLHDLLVDRDPDVSL